VELIQSGIEVVSETLRARDEIDEKINEQLDAASAEDSGNPDEPDPSPLPPGDPDSIDTGHKNDLLDRGATGSQVSDESRSSPNGDAVDVGVTQAGDGNVNSDPNEMFQDPDKTVEARGSTAEKSQTHVENPKHDLSEATDPTSAVKEAPDRAVVNIESADQDSKFGSDVPQDAGAQKNFDTSKSPGRSPTQPEARVKPDQPAQVATDTPEPAQEPTTTPALTSEAAPTAATAPTPEATPAPKTAPAPAPAEDPDTDDPEPSM